MLLDLLVSRVRVLHRRVGVDFVVGRVGVVGCGLVRHLGARMKEQTIKQANKRTKE